MAEAAIKISLFGVDRSLGKTFSQAWKKADTLDKKMALVGSRMQDSGRMMTAGFTLPIVAGLGKCVQAAAEEEKAVATMTKVIRNATGATDEQIESIDRWISKQDALTAFADDDLRPALQNLIVATRDIGEAQNLMGIAMDIAAAKGLPLEQVAKAIAKAHDGNVGALGRLGIATKDAEGKTLSFEQIMRNATRIFGGSAQEAASTTAGKFAELRQKLANLSEDIGAVLLPFVERAVEWFGRLAEKLRGMSDEQRQWVVGIALAAAAIGPLLIIVGKAIETFIMLKGAIAGIKGAMTALGAAGGPIFWTIAAIGLLAAGLVVLYQRNERFREVVNRVWGWVKEHVGRAVAAIVEKLKDFGAWLKDVWDRSETLQKVVRKAWDLVKSGVRTNVDLIVGSVKLAIEIFRKTWEAGSALKEKLGGAWDALRAKTANVWNKISSAVSDAKDRIIGYLNAIIRAINTVFRALHINKQIGEIGGGGGESSASAARTSGAGTTSRVSTPAVMDNAGTGADAGAGGGGGVVDWAKAMLSELGVKWPGNPGGLFGGGAKWLLEVVKEALVEVIRKSGGPGMRIVNIAKTMLGTPYLWGGSGPGGFDCSGLIWWAYQQAGYGHLMPRTFMWTRGRQVSRALARPADVLFYRAGGAKQGVKYGHVKMYAGGGQTIESTRGGVQMRPADWAGAAEVRTYLAKGGVIIGGEAGEEGVLPLTDARAMKMIRDSLGIGSYVDRSQLTIVMPAGLTAREAEAIAERRIAANEARKRRALRDWKRGRLA